MHFHPRRRSVKDIISDRLQTRGEIYPLQCRTSRKSPGADPRHPFGYIYGTQARAARKRILSHLRRSFGNDEIGHFFIADIQFPVLRNGTAHRQIQPYGKIGNIHFQPRRLSVKDIISDRLQARGEICPLQCRTSRKSPGTDLRHPFGYIYGTQARTPRKRILSHLRHALGNDEVSHFLSADIQIPIVRNPPRHRHLRPGGKIGNMRLYPRRPVENIRAYRNETCGEEYLFYRRAFRKRKVVDFRHPFGNMHGTDIFTPGKDLSLYLRHALGNDEIGHFLSADIQIPIVRNPPRHRHPRPGGKIGNMRLYPRRPVKNIRVEQNEARGEEYLFQRRTFRKRKAVDFRHPFGNMHGTKARATRKRIVSHLRHPLGKDEIGHFLPADVQFPAVRKC